LHSHYWSKCKTFTGSPQGSRNCAGDELSKQDEGNPKLSVSIGDDGRLAVKRQSTEDTGIDGGGEVQGFSGIYKKCSQSLSSPY